MSKLDQYVSRLMAWCLKEIREIMNELEQMDGDSDR